MKIQITGASGSGKTHLGKILSNVMGIEFLDTDDILWVWDDNLQPYTVAVSDTDACQILEQKLSTTESLVASGMFYPWSEPLIDQFDLLVIVETDKEVRKKRIIEREYEMYGDRFKKGGDMYEQFNSFLNWAMSYDTFDDKLGSKKATDDWSKKFNCDILYIDGAKSIDEKIHIVMEKINQINDTKYNKVYKKG